MLESALLEKSHLSGSISYILGRLASEALVPHGERPVAPALPVGIDVARRHVVVDATLTQLVTDLQGTVPSLDPLHYEILCETFVGQEILGLERVQRLADEVLRESPRGQLAAQLGARVLAAREQCRRLVTNRLAVFVQASASSAASTSSASSAAEGVRARSLSRSAPSISLAVSTFCLRYSRTLSRPWPIRSPL